MTAVLPFLVIAAKPPVFSVSSQMTVHGPEVPSSTLEAAARPVWIMNYENMGSKDAGFRYVCVGADGQRVAHFDQTNRIFGVSWSPDGTRYAFLTGTKADGSHLIVQTPGGDTSAVQITAPAVPIMWTLAWSLDGRRIAFITYARNPKATTTEYSLIVMDSSWRANSKGPKASVYRLTATTCAGFPPLFSPPDKLRWSPDGKLILVSWGNVVVVDLDGGAQTVVHKERAAATWAPGGKGVCYLAMVDSDDPGQRHWSGFYVRRLDEAKPRVIADVARLHKLGLVIPWFTNGTLDFSPDGRAMAIGGYDGEKSYTLHIFSVGDDGGIALENPDRTITGIGPIAALDWSPDSRSVAAVVLPAAPEIGNSAKMLDAVVTIYARTGDFQQDVGHFDVPASPEYLDLLGMTKILSWSH